MEELKQQNWWLLPCMMKNLNDPCIVLINFESGFKWYMKIRFRVWLNFLKRCHEIFVTNLSFSKLMLVLKEKKLFQQIAPNQLFPIVTKNNFLVWIKLFVLVWNYSKMQVVFFSIFAFYPTIVIVMAKGVFGNYWKLVMTSRTAVKTFLVKMLKNLISYK